MKWIAAAFATTGLVAFGAARAETSWVGTAMVLPTPPAICGTAAGTGDYATLIYRPAGAVFGNGANSYLAYVGRRSNFTMMVPGALFQAGVNYASRYVTSWIVLASNTGGVTAWSMSPATLSPSTQSATLEATFANFYGVSGCTVTLRAGLSRVP